MVLVTYKRVYYISDEDPTLAKVSSDLVQETDRLSIGEGGPAVAVAEGSSSSSYSRSHIKDTPLDGLLGKGMVMKPQKQHRGQLKSVESSAGGRINS